jgi:hypothetical protein
VSDNPEAEVDLRLYIPRHPLWTAQVMAGTDKEYCFDKLPGQDFFHLIVPGEIYLRSGDEQLCLNCARRRNAVTNNRLFWQERDA